MRLGAIFRRIWEGPGNGDKPADLQAFDTARETLIESCARVTRDADAFGDLLRDMQGRPAPACKPLSNGHASPRKSSAPKKRSAANGAAPSGAGRARKKVRKR